METKKTEIRLKTSDFDKSILNMYFAKRVLKTWKEDFVDETGEVISIERNEVLFDAGTAIDQDILAELKFYKETGDITEVEVSNQRRLAFCVENTWQHPFVAQVRITESKYKLLFYSTSISASIPLIKDYIELNYSGGFEILMLKEFDADMILTDNLKELKQDENPEAEIKETEDDEKKIEKKFYQIEVNITTINADECESEFTKIFVVHTFNINRAMMLIDDYLKKKQDENEQKAAEKGEKYERYEISTAIESAKSISVSRFIPLEFSEAYLSEL